MTIVEIFEVIRVGAILGLRQSIAMETEGIAVDRMIGADDAIAGRELRLAAYREALALAEEWTPGAEVPR